jgi:diguanylate cyclase (GGDEF)-like protein
MLACCYVFDGNNTGAVMRTITKRHAPINIFGQATVKRVAEMTLEETRYALLIDRQTGIGSLIAFHEDNSAVVGLADLDALKYINDTFGHEAGDRLLQTMAAILDAVTGGRAYRLHGDEFAIRAECEANAKAAFEKAQARMNQVALTLQYNDGRAVTHTNFGFSYGIGKTLREADINLQAHKQARTEQGHRRPRFERIA